MAQSDSVYAIGNIVFIPKNESTPPLPEMRLLFLKEEQSENIYPWRAICIELEIDAVGNTMKDAAKNLDISIAMYLSMEKKTANGSVIETAKNITRVVFSKSKQKREYNKLYEQAIERYLIQVIEEKKQNIISREREAIFKSYENEIKKMLINYFSEHSQNISVPVLKPQNKKTGQTSAGKNWVLLFTPQTTSRIPIQALKDFNVWLDRNSPLIKGQKVNNG